MEKYCAVRGCRSKSAASSAKFGYSVLMVATEHSDTNGRIQIFFLNVKGNTINSGKKKCKYLWI